jgi:hypothetical protein
MPKSLNPDQIAMLDKEVSKLDKKLDNKDMEKAMGMLMKKVGIKESDLDELSLSMKNMTKSGISNTGIDKDKLKMGLKDLRKKLDKDKKKDEAHIVRSKKGVASLRRKSYQDNPHTNKGDEKKESVNEIHPAVGAAIGLATKVYSKAKPVIDPLIKKGIDKAAPAISKGVDALKNRLRGKTPSSGSKPSMTDRGFKPQNIQKSKNTSPPTSRGNLPRKTTSATPQKPKKGLSTAAKVALGVGGAYAAKKTYDAVRNRQKEREAERNREALKRQAQRQNDA